MDDEISDTDFPDLNVEQFAAFMTKLHGWFLQNRINTTDAERLMRSMLAFLIAMYVEEEDTEAIIKEIGSTLGQGVEIYRRNLKKEEKH